MSDYLVRQIDATPNIAIWLRARVVGGRGSTRLKSLLVEDKQFRQEVPAAAVFVMIGAEPHTDWLAGVLCLDERGFILTGRDIPGRSWALEREPYPFETSRPGVFAAGDVRAGSVKRVAGAVGEGSVAVGFVHRYLAELEGYFGRVE
jgi:thioredoxin reductase (NADPH)